MLQVKGKIDVSGNYKDVETMWAWWMEELSKTNKDQGVLVFNNTEFINESMD